MVTVSAKHFTSWDWVQMGASGVITRRSMDFGRKTPKVGNLCTSLSVAKQHRQCARNGITMSFISLPAVGFAERFGNNFDSIGSQSVTFRPSVTAFGDGHINPLVFVKLLILFKKSPRHRK